MEQKQVKLIGLRVKNNGIIQAAELTPDLLSKRLVLVTGNIGNGKSSLLNAAKIATSGTDAIKKTDALPVGFVAEALLLDGEVPIYIGVKTDTYQRGQKAGDKKMETYLYTKDGSGKAVQPIIDGVAWTAAQYWKALTTELTYSINDLFSENQTTHRKLIEKLFKPELDALNADEVVARINEARKRRDEARMMCQANGAYMERFQDEGYSETTLDAIYKVNLDAIREKIKEAEIEKDRMMNSSKSSYELECFKLDAEKKDKIQAIKDTLTEIEKKIDAYNQETAEIYNRQVSEYNDFTQKRAELKEKYTLLREELIKFTQYPANQEQKNEQGRVFIYAGSEEQQALFQNFDKLYVERWKSIKSMQEPKLREAPHDLIQKQAETIAALDKAQQEPVNYPEIKEVDTTEIDKRLEEMKEELERAEKTNNIYQRYMLWRQWVDAKGEYEKEVDTLRRLYASIETGVPGMKIVPRDTDSGKVEVWVMYNGQYAPEYFGNPEQKQRFMFDYSSFQRTIIGLMLQSARLNLKPRALRIAFVDDVAFTKSDVNVLANVAEELDLKLITAWTHEADATDLMDGQVLVDGGEVFFNKERNYGVKED
jgi:energy-coupling factor transporter ATP-binding protein EcfA2